VSLSGSVEDLPLLEILQVVAFCQKTGHLSVRAPQGDAAVVFEGGRVVSGYIWDEATLSPEASEAPGHEAVVRKRIATVLERLVRLHEGEFSFSLTNDVPRKLGGRDLSGEMLPGGINPEELMLDLARQLDEDRRNASAVLEASLSAPEIDDVVLDELPPEDLEPVVETPAGPAVLLVDDEADVLRVVGERLGAAGFDVSQASSPRSARREMSRLEGAGPFLLVVDLGLPTETGTTFRGGLDVARAASGLKTPPPVLLMAEALDEKLRARAKRLGISLLAFKPGLSKLDPLQYEADLTAFGDKLARDLLPRLEGRRGAAARRPAALPAPTAGDGDARANVLRSALEELDRGADPDLVAFLLLRAARSFFPRVLLFVVKDEGLRGLSGFGPVDSGDSLDLLARELVLSLDEPSPLGAAVARGEVWSGPLPPDGPLRALLDRVGALGATSGAVLPVRAQRETIAVLYGDAPDGGELPPIDALAEFLDRAGHALEEGSRARRTAAALA
jgi:CheY-like chemotaxis protein